jgi:hypothetical protein
MNLQTLIHHLEAIGSNATKAPHIAAINDDATKESMSFAHYILSFGSAKNGGGKPAFKAHYREEEKEERTRLAEAALNSGYTGEDLDDPGQIVDRLKEQLLTNAKPDGFAPVDRWWSLVRQDWGRWMIRTGRA